MREILPIWHGEQKSLFVYLLNTIILSGKLKSQHEPPSVCRLSRWPVWRLQVRTPTKSDLRVHFCCLQTAAPCPGPPREVAQMVRRSRPGLSLLLTGLQSCRPVLWTCCPSHQDRPHHLTPLTPPRTVSQVRGGDDLLVVLVTTNVLTYYILQLLYLYSWHQECTNYPDVCNRNAT